MGNFAIAIFIVFAASIARGQEISIRKELTISVFHPIQYVQGWLGAQLDARLLGDEFFTDLLDDVYEETNQRKTFEEFKSTLERERSQAREQFDRLEDKDFKNPAQGRESFSTWYNVAGKVIEEYASCLKQIDLANATLKRMEEKNNELLKGLKILSEELESCINNSGFIGFFKSIICTLKLAIIIPFNTATVPNLPVGMTLFIVATTKVKSLLEGRCPPPITKTEEFTNFQAIGDILEYAKNIK